MTRAQQWFVIVAMVLLGSVLGVVYAQQQQSGGAGSSVNAIQSGTWTVQPGNTANTIAWKVDGSAVTQPVSAASLPLPSGAATAAKQPAIGTAGSASVDVLSVQGIAGATAIKVDGSAVTQPVSGTVTVNALPASTNVIGKEVPITECGTTVLSQALVAVPTGSTAVTATKTCVYSIVITNTNASPQTVTVTDGQGAPVTAVGPAYSVPGLSQVTFPFNGVAFTAGIKWQAGGTGMTGGIVGVQ